jgi:hypothetical protein
LLKVGSKLRAKWTENFTDFVSQDGVYEIVEMNDRGGFYIINDKGEKCFPISTDFTVIK